MCIRDSNNTFQGWYSSLPGQERKRVRQKLRCSSANVHSEAVKRLMNTKAEIVIIPLQDVLGLGSSSRMNTPGLVSKRNWSWVSPEDWKSTLRDSWFSESVKTSGRLPWFNG